MKVVNLSTTPIKGFQLHHPASVEITARGATGDREFFFVDQENTMISMTMAGELAAMKATYDIGDYRGRQESKFGVGYYFGVYATCVQPGTISIGDAIVKQS